MVVILPLLNIDISFTTLTLFYQYGIFCSTSCLTHKSNNFTHQNNLEIIEWEADKGILLLCIQLCNRVHICFWGALEPDIGKWVWQQNFPTVKTHHHELSHLKNSQTLLKTGCFWVEWVWIPSEMMPAAGWWFFFLNHETEDDATCLWRCSVHSRWETLRRLEDTPLAAGGCNYTGSDTEGEREWENCDIPKKDPASDTTNTNLVSRYYCSRTNKNLHVPQPKPQHHR